MNNAEEIDNTNDYENGDLGPKFSASNEYTIEQLAKPSAGKNFKFGEIVCVGATVIIIVLLLCIWILYEIKEDDV